MNQGTNLGSQIGRWIVLAAVVALLGALLLTIRPVGAQDAPPSVRDAKTLFDYAENGKGPVTTYKATDPEKKSIFWTLGGPDAADFTIAGGALHFMTPPNFEVPSDRVNDEDGSGETLPAVNLGVTPPVLGEGAANNVYKVTVRFGAGGEDGTPGEPADDPADEYDGDDLGEIELTITVTNVNEPGMLVISPMQPQVGTELMAILTDEDNIAPGQGEWQWASSDSMTGTFTDIPERSGDRTYRPTEDDLDKYLQATVEYVDRAGADLREVKAVSAYRVRVDTNTSNQDPKFPDQSTLTGVTTDLVVPVRGVTDRFIPETATAETHVGAPVTAFDDKVTAFDYKTDIEVITYSLRDADGNTSPNGVASDDDGNTDTPAHNDGHAASFDIHAETGQITVSARAMLDADGAGATNPYNVVVRAVDGDGDTQNIDVAIHVLEYHEPPVIVRVYQTASQGHSVGDRVPTEFSHWEADRTPRSPTTLDADLESGVLEYPADPSDGPTLRTITTDSDSLIEAATYYATDPDADTTFRWTLEGDDKGKFDVNPRTGNNTTLAFVPTAFKDGVGPDFENPEDTNTDNVYEVTIVVTDDNLHRDELPVTVKVINSAEDNKPGEVKFSNRVPEVGIALKAEFSDPDTPTSELWQWYRSVADTAVYPAACPDDSTDGDVRYFIDEHPTVDPAAWVAIPGATKPSYTPGYDEDSGGSIQPDADSNPDTVVWAGGDIGVTVSTDDEGNKTYSAWTSPRCLRATVTYRDAVDRTHAAPDDATTRDVDETLEGTFQGTQYPVKPIDEENDAPEFLDPAFDPISVYQADDIEDIAENTEASGTDAAYSLLIKDAPDATDLAASDPFTDEDDATIGSGTNDILTYSLSGADKAAFVIVGSIENPLSYDPDGDGTVEPIDEQGALVFKSPASLDLDYEDKREYRVTVTATDPSGELDSVDVIVNITNVNEGPWWVTTPPTSPRMVVYDENDTADVAVYLAKDPEESGVTYSLVTAAGTILGTKDPADTTDDAEVVAGQFEDHALFDLSSTRGILRFKASPNYEDPQDDGTVAADNLNMYQVTVKAEVADDENPRHATIKTVTVTVINVNEAPVFSKTTDTLEISENPDDPEKEATPERWELYLLNRGVGKPAANLPVEPNLDVGIPMVAEDDDNTWVAVDYTAGTAINRTTRPVQLIDGLTYTFIEVDAKPFHIVPATGQILTEGKLDYETKNTYRLTVTATDPWGLTGSIPVTINVTDVDEQPIPRTLGITGDSSPQFAENGTDAVGEYTATAYGVTVTNPAWTTLGGADGSYFMLEGTGNSRMLKFKSAPDYDAMADADGDNVYEVTLNANDPSNRATPGTFSVSVEVTDVNELGALTGPASRSVFEGTTSTGAPYTLTGGTMDDSATWSVEGTDMDQFTVTGTGMSRMLMFTSAPDYENPMGGAADDSNTYMVTVKAEAGGEMEMVEVTVTVDDAIELGTLVGAVNVSYDEGETGDVGTYSTTGPATATWSLDGDDAADFSISSGGVLTFNASPDFEAPADANLDNDYEVTVKAEASGEMAMMNVTVMVDNVDEDGTVTLAPTRPSVGTAITATLADADIVETVSWQWASSDAMDGTFTNISGATSATYTPVAADANMWLRAMATYTDGFDSGNTAMAVSASAVSQVPVNVAPEFPSASTTRAIAENTAANANIGSPVAAIDDNGDTLTYTLGGTDAASFRINGITGQLRTSAALNYEAKSTYNVVVRASDPAGLSDTIDVTINVTDVVEVVPEVPAIVQGYDTNNTPGIQISELFVAIDDYFDGQINISELFEVIDAYFG